MSVCIRYTTMTLDVLDFCGKDNIETEAHQTFGGLGYFLIHKDGSATLLKRNMYIYYNEETKELKASFEKPLYSDLITLKPDDATHVERVRNRNLYYKVVKGELFNDVYIWTGVDWDICSMMGMVDCKTKLVELG